MVGVAERLRRQVVALKIVGSIPSTHPKLILLVLLLIRPFFYTGQLVQGIRLAKIIEMG